MLNLKIITSTTRPGRKGIAIAKWMYEIASKNENFSTELLDIAELNLPLMDEPNHPKAMKYTQEHTKKWSSLIAPADAFIIVLGEYNFSYPAPIKNALDYLFNEWAQKPVGIVSYGGVSGGLRATQQLKQVLTTLSMMPIVESVTIPFFSKMLDDQDNFNPEEQVSKSSTAMLTALAKWAEALKTMREKN
jgi:NAD(P)H-dependent FMN reductase